MSAKKLILIVLIGAALFGLYRAGAPAAPAGPAPFPQRTAEPAGLRATLTAVPGRLLHGTGVAASKVIAPAVRKMVRQTEVELELTRQELRRPGARPAQTVMTAREGVKRVAAMDTSALRYLDDGRPVLAFKTAMQANALIAAVHDNLRGD